MTVADLIAKLQEFDPDLPVLMNAFGQPGEVDYPDIEVTRASARRDDRLACWRSPRGAGSEPEAVVFIKAAPWVRPFT